MVNLRQAQTGNRVYKGAGQSPNMGQVSAKGAQGYLQREVRNRNQGGVVRPVGNDGKSDSRSGVAARALNRNLGGRPQAGTLKGPGTKPGMKGSNLGTKGQNPAPVGADPIQHAPVVPQISVNDQGLLQLPYSQNMSASALAALEESNAGLMELQAEEQQIAQEAAQQRRDTDLQYGQLQSQTLGVNASGGTAFSSKYGKAVADNATAYSNTLGDIQRQESDFSQQASARRASIQSSLSQQLAASAQEEADRLNSEAGTLGYGTSTTDPHAHKDRPNKPKPNKPKGNRGGPVKPNKPKGNRGGPVKKGKK